MIVEKFRHKRMNSETIGIDPNSADGYDINDVEYAMRVTYSGEFVHAAPWSVGSQGYANVSHGCTGMSTDNAAWLYNQSIPGDVVEYTGTSKQMTLTNGYGDWNLGWAAGRRAPRSDPERRTAQPCSALTVGDRGGPGRPVPTTRTPRSRGIRTTSLCLQR